MVGREAVVCTRCGQVAGPEETFCRGCGAFLEWTAQPAQPAETPPPVLPAAPPARPTSAERPVVGPPVVVTLAQRNVRAQPGGEASLTVEVLNRGRTVDQLSVTVVDRVAGWATVDPPRLNLLPDTTGTATVTFHPPRTPAVQAGLHPAEIAVRSREHPDASIVERVTVEVAPFIELETSLAPSILRGTAEASATIRASNNGNAPIALAFGAEDPELALAFRISPPAMRVEPGAAAAATVTVTPREALIPGPDRTRPFRVLVSASDGAKRSHEATFIQSAVPAPPPKPAPEVVGPLVNLSATNVRVEPGGQAGVPVNVLNRGRTVDQVSFEVLGPAAAWSTVEPAHLNLLPNAWAAAAIVCRPPRVPGMKPGPYGASLAVRSREHPAASVTERFGVEVAPFVELDASLVPSVLRGAPGASARVQAANRGNAPVELALSGEDSEMALEFRISPSTLRMAPGAAAHATVMVRPRAASRSRSAQARPFRALMVAGNGWRSALDGTFIQAGHGHPLAAIALFLFLAVLVAAAGWLTGYFVEWVLWMPEAVSVVMACAVWGFGLFLALHRARRLWRGY